MKTPLITPAQIVAFLQPIITALIAFGVDLTDAQVYAVLGLSASISVAITVADAVIRAARSKALASGNVVASQEGKLYSIHSVAASQPGASAQPSQHRRRR